MSAPLLFDDPDSRPPDIDLGDDHWLWFTTWAPDRALNPQYDGIPDIKRFGAFIAHRKRDGSQCTAGIHFDSEPARRIWPDHPRWSVQGLEPLTISPSVLCLADGCGDHGFIRAGRWVRA